jgi:hypothetical protein
MRADDRIDRLDVAPYVVAKRTAVRRGRCTQVTERSFMLADVLKLLCEREADQASITQRWQVPIRQQAFELAYMVTFDSLLPEVRS